MNKTHSQFWLSSDWEWWAGACSWSGLESPSLWSARLAQVPSAASATAAAAPCSPGC